MEGLESVFHVFQPDLVGHFALVELPLCPEHGPLQFQKELDDVSVVERRSLQMIDAVLKQAQVQTTKPALSGVVA